MDFITLNQKEITDVKIYGQINVPHIVISITGEKGPNTPMLLNNSRIGLLQLKFDDVGNIDNTYLFFTKDQAKQILEFVDKYIKGVSLIIVQCQAGLSRSVAVAAALSKIINYTDDKIFTKGIPNMFVYTTILETYHEDGISSNLANINQIRMRNMTQYLTPAQVKLSMIKNK